MNIYIICPVTIATEEHKAELNTIVAAMEAKGHSVYYPARDTCQTGDAFPLYAANIAAIRKADWVAIYWVPGSPGSAFDLGVAFALGKPICRLNNVVNQGGITLERLIQESSWALPLALPL